jgi:hypothetical protein
MNAKLERITPETAAVMLQLNKDNRPVSTRQVKALAHEIKEGRWQINGDTIAFSADRLIDGQHRLMAIIESGIPVTTFVVRGIASESFLTKDTGNKRKTSDAMAILGVPWAKAVASAALKVWQYNTTKKIGGARRSPSTSELMELYEQHPDILRSVQFVGNKHRIIQQSVAASLHYLFSRGDQDVADKFMQDVLIGANLEPEDPVFLLRQRLVDNVASKSKLPYPYVAALVIKAWNLRREGKTAKQLKCNADEAFPIIK